MTEHGKKLNIWNIIGLGLGGAIGTGIFVLLGFGIQFTGRSILPVVVIGCFFMLLAYWYNLVMPSIFILEGGDYSMKAMLFNPLFSGVGGYIAVINGFAIASYAIAITDYLMILWPQVGNYYKLITFLIVTVFFASTVKGSRFITILQNIITVVLILSLVMFVIFGVPKVNFTEFFDPHADGGFFRDGFSGFISAIAVMGWACQGTTMAPVSMVPVTENPKRTIPMGIIVVTLLLSVVYGLMAYVAGGVLPYDQIAGQNISVTAKEILPKSLFLFFVVGGGIGAIASSLLGGLAMVRYPFIQIADDGWLPEIFKKRTEDGYPYMVYLIFYLIALVPILTGMSLDAAVSLVMIPSMIMNIYMNLACIGIPKTYPKQWDDRSIRIPKGIYIVLSALGALCAGVVAFNLFKNLTSRDAVIASIMLISMFLLSWIRLKQGAVSKETLENNKKEIVRKALEAENM
ncbi:MAG: APC family permease [Peptoniphilus duerdenii]|uniref:APC family permease n=1 Tax=Peptoniphilus duerdenii TaxID=507750 RepID=UPI00254AA2F5|nr:APC family permease [Peptoniphilus duerdenii]MDK8276120.1 APC family permease [Peptoniphilus duerdenii]